MRGSTCFPTCPVKQTASMRARCLEDCSVLTNENYEFMDKMSAILREES